MTATGASAAARDGAAAFGDPAQVDAAQRAIRADPTIQFDLPWLEIKRNPPPRWLTELFEWFNNAIEWVGGGWRVLMWVAIALVVIALVFALFSPAREWLATRLARRGDVSAAAPAWAPEAAVARALLVEADRLAGEGNYDAAVRLLLHRSIEDIEKWRGDPLRPSLTSRDIARIDRLPDAARAVFGRIVADVERSLFAGQPLVRTDWERARADYAGFALAR
ncbi:hypothetical protein FPZ54_05945 [Sphingomonas suaedae]|uniref:DUF4129 domain-containing protein n=1 Tax=Sphingomonas suaedae TaxID=2599297 RepID=A0A518RDS6_9SPHN|nr:hypothetical protein [Sphingomonas suaedae]QDX25603.1 hypothetical protein FPZ54_05945 [Sphingomonas suaedae]